jgi:mannonate dehydratase
MLLKETWRWFGPSDPVMLPNILQTGAAGIVTALHHIPHGDVWPLEEIIKRKETVEAAGFSWDVVESVTIHESIKTRSGNYQHYIDQYKQTIRHLGKAGIPVLTYNFMPVNDWTRTDLSYKMRDGSLALYFNWSDLAVFDIYLLKRANAEAAYPAAIVEEAARKIKAYTQTQLDELAGIIMFGIPGEEKQTIAQMREKLAVYNEIDHAALRSNLQYFLQEIAPVAAEEGIRLAIHPDDPPFDILGLPRIVSTASDLDFILNAEKSESNGICFCTGSLGANPQNNLPEMVKAIGKKIHFVHLRNTRRDEAGNFFEADHLDGDTDMYATVKEILKIQQEVPHIIPFRPDHGHQMLDDMGKQNNPGYSCIGRMRGLAELRGLQLGIYEGLRFKV